jgi:hypothetical protein
MPIEGHVMKNEGPAEKLKLALVGAEKNGKSRLAATGRKPVLFHDFDNRAEALAGIEDVYVISYIDPQWPIQPDAAQLFLTVLSRLEDSLDLSHLKDLVPGKFDNVPKGTMVRTNVVDSITTFGKSFQRYALYGSKDLRREISVGSNKIFLPANWDAWNAEMSSVEPAVLRLLALKSDTTIILHETAEETADSTAEKPRFTGRIGVYPVRYRSLLKYFNEVWRVKLTQGYENQKVRYLPKVYPLPTYEFDAASALLVDPIEDPDIQKILTKSARVAGQKLLNQ